MFTIPLTWLGFAVTDLEQMVMYLMRLFPFVVSNQHFIYYPGDFIKYGKIYFISLVAGVIFMTGMPRKIYEAHKSSFLTALLLLVVFWICVYFMKIGADDPFLYFRF